jgi:hypothetical protein
LPVSAFAIAVPMAAVSTAGSSMVSAEAVAAVAAPAANSAAVAATAAMVR